MCNFFVARCKSQILEEMRPCTLNNPGAFSSRFSMNHDIVQTTIFKLNKNLTLIKLLKLNYNIVQIIIIIDNLTLVRFFFCKSNSTPIVNTINRTKKDKTIQKKIISQ